MYTYLDHGTHTFIFVFNTFYSYYNVDRHFCEFACNHNLSVCRLIQICAPVHVKYFAVFEQEKLDTFATCIFFFVCLFCL